jgi:hypothetical protein
LKWLNIRGFMCLLHFEMITKPRKLRGVSDVGKELGSRSLISQDRNTGDQKRKSAIAISHDRRLPHTVRPPSPSPPPHYHKH